MAKYFSKDVTVIFDKYNVGTITTRVALGLESNALDPTSLGDAGVRATAGIRQDSIEWSGIYDDSEAMDAAAAAHIGSGAKAMAVYFGSNTGSIGYAGTVHLHAVRPVVAVADLVRHEVILGVDNKLDRCVVIAPLRTATIWAALGSLDNGASSTAGGTLYAFMLNMTGSLATGTGTLHLQHSADSTTWASIISATFASAAGEAGTRIGTPGTIFRYVRNQYTSSTAGTATYAALFNRG